MSTLKHKVLSGLIWSYGERISAQLVSLIVSIVLARLLSPEEFGVIAIIMIFITFCDAVVTGGLGNALVQKKDIDELDVNSMLFCSIILSVVLYVLLFVFAPFISSFFAIPSITVVLRILGIRLLVSGVNSIQRAWIQKKTQFRKFFYATSIGTSISAIIGIMMAYHGFGVWSLVAQYLSNALIDTIVLFFIDDWMPRFQFSWHRAKSMLIYGWKVLVSTIVFTIEGNLRSILIGKQFGSVELAYFDQGRKFPNLIVVNINSTIGGVLFPFFSSTQNDLIILKNMCRRSIKVCIYILAPILIGLICIANDFVEIVYTEKWLKCVPILQIIAASFLFRPLSTTCNQAILSLGKSGESLKAMIVINIVDISVIFATVFVFHNIYYVALGALCSEFIGMLCYMYYIKKELEYKYYEQIRDIIPSIVLAMSMGVFIYPLHLLPINSIIIVVLQIVLGIMYYIIVSFLFKFDNIDYILNSVRNRTSKMI